MTWSSNPARDLRTGASPAAPFPVMWAPEELALDTRGLHEALHHHEEDEDAAHPAAPDPELLERAMQDAYERGVAEGRRVGDQEATARLRHAVDAVTEALESLHAEADRWVGNAEENICALAIAVARQVIAREVTLDKTGLSTMVEQALEEFPLDQPITLRLNAQDLQVINSAFQALGEASPLAARKEVQWLADPRISVGGCLIEGRDRIVDGRVDTALERLYRRITYTGA